MNTTLLKKIFSGLEIPPEEILDEAAIRMIYEKMFQFVEDIAFYEQKYQTTFGTFNSRFRHESAPAELITDWINWRFAEEGVQYWNDILKELVYIRNYQKMTF
ncbi:MAG: hypothetical protein HQK63_08335 [Desulfamplus sp.]|nr:hypothetical protein [Desulfamplus sp.]